MIHALLKSGEVVFFEGLVTCKLPYMCPCDCCDQGCECNGKDVGCPHTSHEGKGKCVISVVNDAAGEPIGYECVGWLTGVSQMVDCSCEGEAGCDCAEPLHAEAARLAAPAKSNAELLGLQLGKEKAARRERRERAEQALTHLLPGELLSPLQLQIVAEREQAFGEQGSLLALGSATVADAVIVEE